MSRTYRNAATDDESTTDEHATSMRPRAMRCRGYLYHDAQRPAHATTYRHATGYMYGCAEAALDPYQLLTTGVSVERIALCADCAAQIDRDGGLCHDRCETRHI